MPPSSNPRMTCWVNWLTRGSARQRGWLARAPGRRRILRLAVGDARRENRVVGAVLDLFDDHRLVDVDAAAVELDLAEEGHDVETGERIPDLAGVEGPGRLNRFLEGEAGCRRLRDVVVGRFAAAVLLLVGLHIVCHREVK